MYYSQYTIDIGYTINIEDLCHLTPNVLALVQLNKLYFADFYFKRFEDLATFV